MQRKISHAWRRTEYDADDIVTTMTCLFLLTDCCCSFTSDITGDICFCPCSFVCLFTSVCLSVCEQDYSKKRAWIWMKCCVSTDVGTWTNWLTFEPDPDIPRRKIPRSSAYTISEKAVQFRHPDYDPDGAQKLTSSSMSRHLSTRNISSKSMNAFLSALYIYGKLLIKDPLHLNRKSFEMWV